MNKTNKPILSIALSTRGFGYAVLEGKETLVDYADKTFTGESKNSQCLNKVRKLIAQYEPGIIVLEDVEAKDSRRGTRLRALTRQIIAFAATSKIKVKLFSKIQIRKAFFEDGEGTKHALAEIIAKRFSEDLAHRLPPERLPWKSEDSRMGIFDAVALALMI